MHSFAKVAEAFDKLRYRDTAQLKLGRQLLITTTTRAVPNSYSGASA